jgi:AraC family transcriptional regulator of adaptative response / DNA-3-methyladenine glycosylase II
MLSENGEHGVSGAGSMAAMKLPNPALDTQVCDQARRSRDARFDGLFFTAVISTGIYCRPVCPAPAPKPKNIRYFAAAAAAEAAGFRPCLRCRPELAPGSQLGRGSDSVVARALAAIQAGALSDDGMEALAARVGLSSRQLRRRFEAELGATPLAVAITQRLLFAKQLLAEAALPITEVALAAGFQSLRRFNAAFHQAYRLTPSSLRRQAPAPLPSAGLSLQLGLRPPFDFAGMLDFLRARALPGIDSVETGRYQRYFPSSRGLAWLLVEPARSPPGLRLTVHNLAAGELAGVVARVRRLFDLDADPACINAVLGADPWLAARVRRQPGRRIVGSFDPFETAVRAVLGQQISVAAARTMAIRLVDRFGPLLASADSGSAVRGFPRPEALAEAALESIGLIRQRADTVRRVASALAAGQLSLRPDQRLSDFLEGWTAIPGIGDWTAHYIALRALSHPDAFPAGDLILRRRASSGATLPSAAALARRSADWRPWRGYAAMHLWQDE